MGCSRFDAGTVRTKYVSGWLLFVLVNLKRNPGAEHSLADR